METVPSQDHISSNRMSTAKSTLPRSTSELSLLWKRDIASSDSQTDNSGICGGHKTVPLPIEDGSTVRVVRRQSHSVRRTCGMAPTISRLNTNVLLRLGVPEVQGVQQPTSPADLDDLQQRIVRDANSLRENRQTLRRVMIYGSDAPSSSAWKCIERYGRQVED